MVEEKDLQEAAEAGAICPSCGGLHVPDVDTAILVSAAEDEAGQEIPWCDCECAMCRELKEALGALQTEEKGRPHEAASDGYAGELPRELGY